MDQNSLKNYSQFTAVFLVAGGGDRIKNVTTEPKILLSINHETLLEKHLNSLESIGINKIIFVLGYRAEYLRTIIEKYKARFDFTFVLNEDYTKFGNTFSLKLGLEKCITENVLIFDADLIYEPSILKNFVNDQIPNQILVGKASLDDIECAKVLVDNNQYIKKTVDKRAVTNEELSTYSFLGEAIGILKFNRLAQDQLLKSAQTFLSHSTNLILNWEHLLNEFLLTFNVLPHLTQSTKWIEIDNEEDLTKAKTLFV